MLNKTKKPPAFLSTALISYLLTPRLQLLVIRHNNGGAAKTNAGTIELEQPIKLKTADIRKAQRIKLPDAIIAATALVYDFTLISRNLRFWRH